MITSSMFREEHSSRDICVTFKSLFSLIFHFFFSLIDHLLISFYTCRVGGMNQDSFPVFNGYTVQFNSGIPSRSKSVVLSRFWFSQALLHSIIRVDFCSCNFCKAACNQRLNLFVFLRLYNVLRSLIFGQVLLFRNVIYFIVSDRIKFL